VTYTHGLTMKAREGASYVMEAIQRGKATDDFNPPRLVRRIAER